MPSNDARIIFYSGLVFDYSKNEVRICGRTVTTLSATQRELLYHLLTNIGRLLSRAQLLDILDLDEVCDRAVDTHINRLRKKLFPADKELSRAVIETVQKAGYRIPEKVRLDAKLDALIAERAA